MKPKAFECKNGNTERSRNATGQHFRPADIWNQLRTHAVSCVRCLSLFAALVLVLSHCCRLEAQGPEKFSQQKVSRILAVSRHAANNSMQDLSLRAAREALGNGPPIPARDEKEFGPKDESDRQATTDASIAENVASLATLWRDQKFNSNAIQETLVAIVFPKHQPDQVFPYRFAEAETPAFSSRRSVGLLLIQYSIETKRTAELHSLLERRLSSPSGRISAWEMLLSLAIENNNSADALGHLLAFQPNLINHATKAELTDVCLVLLNASRDRTLQDAAVTAMEYATARMVALSGSMGRNLSKKISLTVFHQRLHTDNAPLALLALERWDAMTKADRGTENSSEQIQHHADMAQLLLLFGMHEQALPHLNEVVLLESQSEANRVRFESKLISVVPNLHQLAAKDRYPILHHCFIGHQRSNPSVPSLTFRKAEQLPERLAGLVPDLIRNSQAETRDHGHAGEMVSSAVMLVEAAIESGSGDLLKAELQQLQTQQKPAGGHLSALYYLCAEDLAEAGRAVAQIRDELRQDSQHRIKLLGRDLALDLVVAMKAAEHSNTRSTAVEILNTICRLDVSDSHGQTIARASIFRSMLAAESADNSLTTILDKSSPKLWAPSIRRTKSSTVSPDSNDIWSSYEGVISHQSQKEHDCLYFPWPLSGTFEFRVSSFIDVCHSGGLAFDGLTHHMVGESSLSVVSGIDREQSVRRSLQLTIPGNYSRTSVRVSPETLTFLVNGHPVYSEPRDSSGSPWLALVAGRFTKGVWRFPEFIGTPEVMSEVCLSDDSRLRGWKTGSSSQVLPNVQIAGDSTSAAQKQLLASRVLTDWQCLNEMIVSHKNLEATEASGHLQYDRPMLTEETVTWEFEYSEGTIETHPAIGRLVFLLRPNGVRLHWIPVSDVERAILPFDHELPVTDDPTASRKVPFVNGWNKASLSLQTHGLTLSVNGTEVYQHEIRPIDSHQFGLFHFRDRTESRVRNVVLSGNWPRVLNDESFQQLMVGDQQPLTLAENKALDRITGDQPFSASILEVMNHAAKMKTELRYKFLCDWVLPSITHPRWRMFATLKPKGMESQCSGSIRSNLLISAAFNTGDQADPSGGFVLSPALELIAIAKELGKLDELRVQVEACTSSKVSSDHGEGGLKADTVSSIAPIALQLMLAIEQSRMDAGADLMQQIHEHATRESIFTEENIWPYLMACQQSTGKAELRQWTRSILNLIAEKQCVHEPNSTNRLNLYVASAISLLKWSETPKLNNTPLVPTSPWQPLRIQRADLRAAGMPASVWSQSADGTIQHLAGFEEDLLCLSTPLIGNFDFQCELTPVDGEHLLIGYAGFFIKPSGTNGELQRIPWGRDSRGTQATQSIPDANSVWNYHLTSDNGILTVLINDRRIFRETIAPGSPPWLCIRAATTPGASVGKIRLIGTPSIPQTVALDTDRGLEGWCRPFFGGVEPFLPQNRSISDWRSDETVLTGLHRESLAGTRSESLLQYFRPMLEDGWISYSFFYDKRSTLVHPSIGEVAFILDAVNGVRQHQITNGPWDTQLIDSADDIPAPESQQQRPLPLKDNDWNSLQISVEGNQVRILLNDVPVFMSTLAPGLQRTFGLFHFKDETSARVRDLIWRGKWPEKLPVAFEKP